MGSHVRTRIARVIRFTAGGLSVILAVGSVAVASSAPRRHGPPGRRAGHHHRGSADAYPTATPIKHIGVVFQENRSFDRYFGTYSHALNPPGEPRFVPAPGTPTVNGLTPALLTHNPNLANPMRLGA
jgi:phospholipase C